MAVIPEERAVLNKVNEDAEATHHDEIVPPDVVGLRIPRQRVLATLTLRAEGRKLPSRMPHAVFEVIEEDE